MKFIRFLFFTAINLAIIYTLNTRFSPYPPIGKFLNPFHGFWKNGESVPEKSTVFLEKLGLQQSAKVVYDQNSIPRIFAQNEHDLYFLQGYVTARHRLWQMEFQTHAAAGRLSEIIGESDQILDWDRMARRIGLTKSAENFIQHIKENDAQVATIMMAYTLGINTYIDELSYENLPIEYKLLDYRPEYWSIHKSALLLKYMNNTLNRKDVDKEYTNAFQLFGADTFNILYPSKLLNHMPIVNKPNSWNFDSTLIVPKNPPATPYPAPLHNKPVNSKVSKRYQNVNTDFLNIGSNNWAISGEKTLSGNPILCNDPHLRLTAPSIWYAIQLTAPGINVMGVSLPGSPNIIIGYNDSIAWGVTNARRDVADWYTIQFQDDKQDLYWLDSKWKKIERRIESIKIRGIEQPYTDTVMYTYWGPIVYDDSFHPEEALKYAALKWIALSPSEEIVAFYLLNQAKNYADFQQALTYYSSPAQNFVFAAASGDIAIQVQGKFPVKRKDQGKYVLNGTDLRNDWTGFTPEAHLIKDKNPARGFVSSANQYPVDATYPYFVYDHHYEHYRNRRINNILDSLQDITVQDMMRMQGDNFNLKAAENLKYWMSLLNIGLISEVEKDAYATLSKWNYYNDPYQVAASYFKEWEEAIYELVWDEMDNDTIDLLIPERANTLHLLREMPNFKFFDRITTPTKENAQSIIQMAFTLAVERVENWKTTRPNQDPIWSVYKDTYLEHLSRQFSPFNIDNVNNGGGRNIINATSRYYGPSWRMVVELTPKGPKAWGVYPGGQSGNPGSPYYRDMVNTWVKRKYFSLDLLEEDQVVENTLTELYNYDAKK